MRTASAATLLSCLLLGCEGQAKLPATCLDTLSDPQNCGGCGQSCPPAGAHATAVCSEGQCGTVCEAGWLDLQADAGGCESPSSGLPETGPVVFTPSSSTSLLQLEQANATHRNQAILGDPGPLAPGAPEQTSQTHRNVTAFPVFQQ